MRCMFSFLNSIRSSKVHHQWLYLSWPKPLVRFPFILIWPCISQWVNLNSLDIMAVHQIRFHLWWKSCAILHHGPVRGTNGCIIYWNAESLMPTCSWYSSNARQPVQTEMCQEWPMQLKISSSHASAWDAAICTKAGVQRFGHWWMKCFRRWKGAPVPMTELGPTVVSEFRFHAILSITPTSASSIWWRFSPLDTTDVLPISNRNRWTSLLI